MIRAVYIDGRIEPLEPPANGASVMAAFLLDTNHLQAALRPYSP